MSDLNPAQFRFLYRQEFLIQFGLLNGFYGASNDPLSRMRLIMCLSPGVYVTLIAFLVYFFCEYLSDAHNTSIKISLGTSKNKQTSYKVLMGLIVLMFSIQTIHNICNWYIAWLGFIHYSHIPDKALNALELDGETSLSLHVFDSMFILLATWRLAIADSIMVSTRPTLPASSTYSHRLEGLEVLDHMQQQLEGRNCPYGLQLRVYRYAMAHGEK
jgi:hypothetical protein